tara:strand:- start:20157 stop:21077 length:921 start_codon:yes stop_codon:yes gene_type:complete
MRIAAIDLGTNSLLLTIVQVEEDQLIPLLEKSSILRLGKNLNETGEIGLRARKRCMGTLTVFCSLLSEYEVDCTLAAGTHALRTAENGNEIIEEIVESFNIHFEIIDGKREAELVFKTTQNEFVYLNRDFFMFDIGGGSTEFVVGDSKSISRIESFPFGTVNLFEQFVTHDPLTDEDISSVKTEIEKYFYTLTEGSDLQNTAAIGVAGTITTLKTIQLSMDEYDRSSVHRSILTANDIDRLTTTLCRMTLKERLALAGLPEKRADIIPFGAIITKTIMDQFGFEKIYVNDRGLRWGLLYDWLEKQN